MRDINEICLTLLEDLDDIAISGPLSSNLRDALHADDVRLSVTRVNELKRLLEALAPLARRGSVKEVRTLV